MIKKKRTDDSQSDKGQSKIKIQDHRTSARSDRKPHHEEKEAEDLTAKSTDAATKQLDKSLEEQLTELQEKERVYIDRLQRQQAEFENYRKRVDRERIESWVNAKSDLVLKMLGILDDFDRVASIESGDEHAYKVMQGVQLVEKKLRDVFQDEGLQEISALGQQFDPNIHEALLSVETDDSAKDNVVSEIFIKGYMFKQRLLRPVRVKVMKYVSKNTDAPDQEDSSGSLLEKS